MRKGLIVLLVCVNVGLLAALLAGTGVPRAEAQVVGGGRDYLMMTGHIADDRDALWVLDLARRRLAAFRFDSKKNRLLPYRGRELKEDFRGRAKRD